MKRHVMFALLALGTTAHAQGQLQFVTDAQPDTLDIQKTSATSTFQIAKSLYDTLLEPDAKGKLIPALAKSWTVSKDQKQMTFQLRPGVQFQDGSKLDAQDVVATFQRLMNPKLASPKLGDFEQVASVEAVNDLTVRFILKKPFAPLLASLASGWAGILPSEKVAANWDFATKPVGTGPFILQDWKRDNSLTLIRNPNYFQGAPKVAGVKVNFVTDPAVRLQGLLSGTFDGLGSVSTTDIRTLRDRGFNVTSLPSATVLVMAINNRRPLLQKPEVRRALAQAIDRQTILDVAYGGGKMVGTFMDPLSPYYRDYSKQYPYNPAAAKAALKRAGVPANWTLDMAVPQNYAAHVQAGEMMQAMLAKVGVRVKLRPVEWGVWLSEVYGGKRNFDLTVIGHTGKLDPHGRLNGFDKPDTNYIGYNNPKVGEWINQAAAETNPTKRRTLYANVFRQMALDMPFVYLGASNTNFAFRKGISGFQITPYLDTFDFRDITLN